MSKEWISVDVDLPRAADTVIFCNHDFTWVGWLDTYEEEVELSWFSCDDREYIDEVTHWMPLPSPYYEE